MLWSKAENLRRKTLRVLSGLLRPILGNNYQTPLLRSHKQAPYGYIERVTNERIEGWTNLSDEVTDFTVGFGDDLRSLPVRRFVRDDVIAAFPDAPKKSGYSIDVPADFYLDISLPRGLNSLRVLAAGRDLTPTAELIEAYDASHEAFVRTYCTTYRALQVQASTAPAPTDASSDWAVQSVGAAQSGLKLRIEIDRPVSRVELQLDNWSEIPSLIVLKSSTEYVAGRFIGFSYLPGVIWDSLLGKNQLDLHLMTATGIVVQTVDLSVEEARGEIELLALQDRKDQSEILLAIEHAKYLAKYVNFSKAARRWLAQKADYFGCNDFLGTSMQTDDLDRSTVASVRANYRDAFRDVLTRLDDALIDADKVILNASKRFVLNKQEEVTLAFAYVSEICRRGRFEEYVNAVPLAEIRRVANSDNRWESTNALPFLAARGDLIAASEILEVLGKQSGWINTECIYVSSRYLQELPGPTAEKSQFVYALVGLLNALSKDYWSRIHDNYLMRAFAIWLTDAETYPHWLLADLESTALKVYGLSPDFWAEMSERDLSASLSQGQKNFSLVQTLGKSAPDEIHFMRIWHALQFFHDLGCSDATIALREAHASALQWFRGNDQFLATLAGLISHRDMDSLLRTSAHPCAPHPVNDAEVKQIYEALRVIGNTDPYGERSYSQLGAAMKAAGQMISGHPDSIDDAGLCCTNGVRDSLCESSVVAGEHEQLVPYDVQDQELAFVQHGAEAARFAIDLV